MSKKIFVFGATGTQGKSVCQALVGSGYEVYGMTRNKTSASAQELEKIGVHLVQGDLEDVSSYEHALKGMYGAYLNVDFWAYYKGNNSAEAKATEIRQAKSAVDALRRQGIQHLVYSTLESFHPRQEMPHFDSKAEVTAYIRSQDIPATQFFTSAYYGNVMETPQIDKEGGVKAITFAVPDDTVVPSFAPEQSGLWVKVALDNPDKWIGKDMYACGENITVGEICKTLSDLSGKKYESLHLARDDFFGDQVKGKMPEELWLNWLAFLNGELKRDVAESKAIVPEQWTFKEWAQNTPAVGKKFGF